MLGVALKETALREALKDPWGLSRIGQQPADLCSSVSTYPIVLWVSEWALWRGVRKWPRMRAEKYGAGWGQVVGLHLLG